MSCVVHIVDILVMCRFSCIWKLTLGIPQAYQGYFMEGVAAQL